MAVDRLVDSAKLNAALNYEANKIIAKGGGTAPLTFDLENEKGFGDYVDAIETGTQTAPYVVLTGIITPAADTTSIRITTSGITSLVLGEGHVDDQESYLSDDYNNMALGFYAPFSGAIVPTNYNPGKAVFFVYTSNANKRSYYQQGVTVSFSDGSFSISNSRGVVFKAGIPMRYILVGV